MLDVTLGEFICINGTEDLTEQLSEGETMTMPIQEKWSKDTWNALMIKQFHFNSYSSMHSYTQPNMNEFPG